MAGLKGEVRWGIRETRSGDPLEKCSEKQADNKCNNQARYDCKDCEDNPVPLGAQEAGCDVNKSRAEKCSGENCQSIENELGDIVLPPNKELKSDAQNEIDSAPTLSGADLTSGAKEHRS